MSTPPMPPPPPPHVDPAAARARRRALRIGIAIGLLFPLVTFVATVLPGQQQLRPIGSATWMGTALAGVLLMASDRFHRVGLGIVLGFMGLIVVGAGTCTVGIIAVG